MLKASCGKIFSVSLLFTLLISSIALADFNADEAHCNHVLMESGADARMAYLSCSGTSRVSSECTWDIFHDYGQVYSSANVVQACSRLSTVSAVNYLKQCLQVHVSKTAPTEQVFTVLQLCSRNASSVLSRFWNPLPRAARQTTVEMYINESQLFE